LRSRLASRIARGNLWRAHLSPSQPDSYRIKFDGIEVGSVSKRSDHHKAREYWHWGVDGMPLMDHGGRPPSGDAWSRDAAMQAFKVAFLQWVNDHTDDWPRNRDYIKASLAGRK
jgi:hypothetical protein